jgi:hypothetical protein
MNIIWKKPVADTILIEDSLARCSLMKLTDKRSNHG